MALFGRGRPTCGVVCQRGGQIDVPETMVTKRFGRALQLRGGDTVDVKAIVVAEPAVEGAVFREVPMQGMQHCRPIGAHGREHAGPQDLHMVVNQVDIRTASQLGDDALQVRGCDTDDVVVGLGEVGELRLVEYVYLFVDVDGALTDGGQDDAHAASA